MTPHKNATCTTCAALESVCVCVCSALCLVCVLLCHVLASFVFIATNISDQFYVSLKLDAATFPLSLSLSAASALSWLHIIKLHLSLCIVQCPLSLVPCPLFPFGHTVATLKSSLTRLRASSARMQRKPLPEMKRSLALGKGRGLIYSRADNNEPQTFYSSSCMCLQAGAPRRDAMRCEREWWREIPKVNL